MKKYRDALLALRLIGLICFLGLIFILSFTTISLVVAQDEPEQEETGEVEEETPAVEEAEALPPAEYLGSETCIMCHFDLEEVFNRVGLEEKFRNTAPKDRHVQAFHGLELAKLEENEKGYMCEGCHGPGSNHMDDAGINDISAKMKKNARSGNGCLNCHSKKLSKIKWNKSIHNYEETDCLGCHGEKGNNHGDINRKPSSDICMTCHIANQAIFALPSHHPVKEGRINCSDCHNPHESMGDSVKRDLCRTCHAKQHGPFVFEHGAISGELSDGCLDCHQPHGSPNTKLLKLRNRGLCLQCHGDRVIHFSGRLCWDCHETVHGSNASPQFFE